MERLAGGGAPATGPHPAGGGVGPGPDEGGGVRGGRGGGRAGPAHLYPRLENHGAGRLTKVRAQAVSGRSCRAVAERLGIPERLRAAAPDELAGPATEALAQTERVLASVIEAVIGACYLEFG